MRIDVITIFPGYLAPLSLSLVGKAIESGVVDLAVHDLRTWTHDRHHTADDTPYGGGAGMVMKPEPWGEALDAMEDLDPAPMTVVVPTPAGRVFNQDLAHELSARRRLVFACGRYEGIDARVAEHYRASGCSTTAPTPMTSWRSVSGTTCSTAVRQRCWPSRRPWSGSSRGCSAILTRSSRNHTRRDTGCWNTPTTPNPRAGGAVRSLRSCSPATTQPSRHGVGNRLWNVPARAVPSCSKTTSEGLIFALSK